MTQADMTQVTLPDPHWPYMTRDDASANTLKRAQTLIGMDRNIDSFESNNIA